MFHSAAERSIARDKFHDAGDGDEEEKGKGNVSVILIPYPIQDQESQRWLNL